VTQLTPIGDQSQGEIACIRVENPDTTHALIKKSRSKTRFLCGVGSILKCVQLLPQGFGNSWSNYHEKWLCGKNWVHDKIIVNGNS
jgi:hypothetical protein